VRRRPPIRFLLLALIAAPAPTVGVLPPHVEPDYAEAVLAYQNKDFPTALERLGQVLQAEPQSVEAFELRGLVLSAQKSYAGAIDAYHVLLRMILPRASAEAKAAGYHYELGRLYFLTKKLKDSRRHLARAIKAGFNTSAARLFLGMIHLEDREWASATEELRAVLASDATDLKPTARLYLAQAASGMSDPPLAARRFAEARAAARDLAGVEGLSDRNRELALQVASTAETQLRAFDQTTLTASIGLLGGYDSNVLALPTGTTGAASGKGALLGSLTYGSSPTRGLQLVGNYRATFTLNSNPASRSGQFFTHDLSGYLTRRPLLLTNYGFKIATSGVLQYQTDTGTGRAKYGPYSLSAALGPYGRLGLDDTWVVGAEAFFQPQKFYLDAAAEPQFRRSGWDQSLRVWVGKGTPAGAFNPVLGASGGYNLTTGHEYRAGRVGLDLSNTAFLGEGALLSTVLSVTASFFKVRPGGNRTDTAASAAVSLAYALFGPMTLLLDLQYLYNQSNVTSYRYSRVQASAGMTAAF